MTDAVKIGIPSFKSKLAASCLDIAYRGAMQGGVRKTFLLDVAIQRRSNRVARALVESGRVDIRGMFLDETDTAESVPLITATKTLNEEIFLMIFRLFCSAQLRHSTQQRTLQHTLKKLVDTKTTNTRTEESKASMLSTLLECELLDFDQPDQTGHLPLHYVCKVGANQHLDYALSKTRTVDVRNEEGFTPFHLAVKVGNDFAARTLMFVMPCQHEQ